MWEWAPGYELSSNDIFAEVVVVRRTNALHFSDITQFGRSCCYIHGLLK